MSPQSQKTEEEKIYQSKCVTTLPALLRVRLVRLRAVVLHMHACVLSCTSVVSDSETLRIQAPTPLVPLSMGFSRQESWSGLPCPPPGNLPNPRIKPTSLTSSALQADSLPTKPLGKPYICTK